MMIPSSRLMELPGEIQLRIFAYALKVEVAAIYDHIASTTKRKNHSDMITETNDAFPMYKLPRPPALLHVNHHIRRTVIDNLQWRSRICYVFTSTIAMLDVLTTWPKDKLKQIRRIKLMGHVLPIHKINHELDGFQPSEDWTNYGLGACLNMIQGLELDLLEVYHPYSISPYTYGGREALRLQILDLMPSCGWREVRLISELPHFKCYEVAGMAHWADQIRNDKERPGDDDYDFFLPGTSVIRDVPTNYIIGLQCPGAKSKNKRRKIIFNHAAFKLFEDKFISGGYLILACKRGTNAKISQPEEIMGPLGDLLKEYTWQDIRKSDKFINKGLPNIYRMFFDEDLI